MNAKFIKVMVMFVFVSAITSGIYLTIYAGVQQSLRQSANSSQIQMAEDISAQLNQGEIPDLGSAVDVNKSLAPVVIVLDKDLKVVDTNAKDLSGIPLPPTNSYKVTNPDEPHIFTWAPRPELREASVITFYTNKDKSGYVLVGRSLRETENIIHRIGLIVFTAWLANEILLLIFFGLKLVKHKFAQKINTRGK
jgi:hypothetical protein